MKQKSIKLSEYTDFILLNNSVKNKSGRTKISKKHKSSLTDNSLMYSRETNSQFKCFQDASGQLIEFELSDPSEALQEDLVTKEIRSIAESTSESGSEGSCKSSYSKRDGSITSTNSS